MITALLMEPYGVRGKDVYIVRLAVSKPKNYGNPRSLEHRFRSLDPATCYSKSGLRIVMR